MSSAPALDTERAAATAAPAAELPSHDWIRDYPPPRSLSLDQEAARIYEHAYAIGLRAEQQHDPAITFSTVLAALLCGNNDTSRWFLQLAYEHGPTPLAVFREKGMDEKGVRELAPAAGKPQPIRLSSDKQLLTASARELIARAEGWAQRVGGSDIGVRHLVASYVLNPPPAHRAQMQSWSYREEKWRPLFSARMAELYTAEQWADAIRGPAPAKSIQEFSPPPVKGAALAFAGDASALLVIEHAAEHHARRQDRWLRWQTVFHALAQTGLRDAAIRAEIQPIADAIGSLEGRYQRAYGAFFPTAAAANATAFEALDISPRVLNALETARELAVATRHAANDEIRPSVLHLAGALVSRRVDGDAELAQMGFKPHELRLELIKHAAAKGEPVEVWREALGEEESLQAGRPLILNSDEPEAAIRLDENWASDPLAIRRDVETFAALLASAGLEPPLSIGLFGPWGSGKTTFLKRLRRAVDRRAGEAKQAISAGRSAPYVSSIVHVEFNAWHFAEGALTSSLIETIFRALSSFIKDDTPIAGRKWHFQKLEALETTKRKVEAAAALEQAASGAVAKAETRLAESRRQAVQATTSAQALVEAAWSATKSELINSDTMKKSGVLEAVGDTITSVEDLRARLEALRNRPARLLGDLGWKKSLLFAGLVLLVPLLFGWLTARVLETGEAVQLLSSVTAVLSVVGVWARAASGAVSTVDKAVAEVASTYAKRLAEDPGVVQAQAAVEAARAKAATAATALRAAREELARARTEVANATLPAQMLQLVSGRIDAQSYSSELTTLSLARADLEALSLLLREQRTEVASRAEAGSEPSASAPSAPARAVDRVILYIDDLDRCKADQVVRVLQLVHMLLAFELFVVVVAVDARWVEEALTQNFRWLGDGGAPSERAPPEPGAQPQPTERRVTPQDYLEKIFQIAFWLEPMTGGRAASYLGSLVRAPARDFGPNLAPGVAHSISGIELDYMRALTAYVGSSPRRVKRLVNAYRLIKAGMSDAQLSTFLARRGVGDPELTSGPYQLVIGLLVIATGAPSSSAQILRELAEFDPGLSLEDLVETFRKRKHPDWNMSARVIETLMRTHKAKNVSELRGWAWHVGRYLLNSPAETRVDEVR